MRSMALRCLAATVVAWLAPAGAIAYRAAPPSTASSPDVVEGTFVYTCVQYASSLIAGRSGGADQRGLAAAEVQRSCEQRLPFTGDFCVGYADLVQRQVDLGTLTRFCDAEYRKLRSGKVLATVSPAALAAAKAAQKKCEERVRGVMRLQLPRDSAARVMRADCLKHFSAHRNTCTDAVRVFEAGNVHRTCQLLVPLPRVPQPGPDMGAFCRRTTNKVVATGLDGDALEEAAADVCAMELKSVPQLMNMPQGSTLHGCQFYAKRLANASLHGVPNATTFCAELTGTPPPPPVSVAYQGAQPPVSGAQHALLASKPSPAGPAWSAQVAAEVPSAGEGGAAPVAGSGSVQPLLGGEGVRMRGSIAALRSGGSTGAGRGEAGSAMAAAGVSQGPAGLGVTAATLEAPLSDPGAAGAPRIDIGAPAAYSSGRVQVAVQGSGAGPSGSAVPAEGRARPLAMAAAPSSVSSTALPREGPAAAPSDAALKAQQEMQRKVQQLFDAGTGIASTGGSEGAGAAPGSPADMVLSAMAHLPMAPALDVPTPAPTAAAQQQEPAAAEGSRATVFADLGGASSAKKESNDFLSHFLEEYDQKLTGNLATEAKPAPASPPTAPQRLPAKQIDPQAVFMTEALAQGTPDIDSLVSSFIAGNN